MRSELAEVAAELTANLTGIFDDEWVRRNEKAERIRTSPIAVMSSLIPYPARLLGIDIASEPRAGLIVRVLHWSVPDGKTLSIFVPAFAESDGEVGLLDRDPEDGGERSFLPAVHLDESLATYGFRNRLSVTADGNFQVPLYPAR